MNLPGVYYLAAFIVLLISQILVLLVLVSYRKLSQDYQKLFRSFNELKRKASASGDEFYHHSQTQAHELIEEAQEKANSILDETKQLDSGVRQFFEQSMQQMQQSQSQLYREVLASVRSHFDGVVHTVQQDLTTELSTELARAREHIQAMASQIATEHKQHSLEMTQKLEQELISYKEQRRQEFDRDLALRVRTMMVQILPKTLTSRDHEELIMAAIEEVSRADKRSKPTATDSNN